MLTFHLIAKRKFNRESLVKLTTQQKQLITTSAPEPQQAPDYLPNTCMACQRKFKNSRGLSIHQKACKGERAEEAKIKGLEPLFLMWENSKQKLSAKEKKKWRDCLRIWLMRRIKSELNLGLAAKNPTNTSIEDDSHIHGALAEAGKTIVPCLLGEHSKCEKSYSGCGGNDAVTDFNILPSKGPLEGVPRQTVVWLNSVVDAVLGTDALQTLVVNGRKATTSLVESVHREIRLPIAKGRMHRKHETALLKSGTKKCSLEFRLTLFTQLQREGEFN